MTSGTSPSPWASPSRLGAGLRAVAAACVLTVAGSAVGVAQQPSISPLDGASPSALSSPSVEEQLQAAQTEVRRLTVERDRLRDALAGIADLYDPMESDRQLLLELRKQLPEERVDAESYLTRMQTLALESDPTRLSQLASRVKETAPVFLEWRQTDYPTPAEANQAYLDSGASGFSTDFEEFRSAILLTVANRLDALLTLQDRVR
jgi:TolA-binding protein